MRPTVNVYNRMISYRSPLVFILPLLHLCLIVAIATEFIPTEGSWKWFPAFLVDLPFSLLLVFLQNVVSPLLVFGILGTLWWYFLSILMAILLAKLRDKVWAA